MKNHTNLLKSSIIDNRKRGIVGDFLAEKIGTDAKLSFVSAYFSIFAYHHEEVKSKPEDINKLRFLFGEPTFIKFSVSNIW